MKNFKPGEFVKSINSSMRFKIICQYRYDSWLVALEGDDRVNFTEGIVLDKDIESLYSASVHGGFLREEMLIARSKLFDKKKPDFVDSGISLNGKRAYFRT